MTQKTLVSCNCGLVRLAIEGAPILSAECCCQSCRLAGAQFETLPGALKILGPHGATRFVLHRKDRVEFLSGLGHLAEHRLSPKTGTRRVIATCCNSPVFLDFKGGHWLSLYGGLWGQHPLPPLQMRTMTSDLPDASVLPSDVPNLRRQSLSFFAKLLIAWAAMGFRNPYLPVEAKVEV